MDTNTKKTDAQIYKLYRWSRNEKVPPEEWQRMKQIQARFSSLHRTDLEQRILELEEQVNELRRL